MPVITAPRNHLLVNAIAGNIPVYFSGEDSG
jgi:hypothetical protein